MLRQELINKLESYSGQWDIIVIGGGATGLGAVLDAASRGYKAILFEQSDFAQGTSSRSTKLVHGGVRYLQQGNVKLVMEALKERGLLKKNAPHLVKNQSFIVPNYKWWEGPYYGLGLKVYDWMSGNLGLGPSEWLSAEEVLERAPTLDAEGLRGGVMYHDGQFDDARLAINIAQTAMEYGALLLNYFEATGFIKTNSKISGVHVKDRLTGKEYKIDSKVVINATGVFSDKIQKLDNSKKPDTITPSDLRGAGGRKGDVVVDLDGCSGRPRGRIVFEAKNSKRSRNEALAELDEAMNQRAADYAVWVVPSEDKLPARSSALREINGDKLFVVFDPEEGSRLALEVAYSLARARVVMAKGGADGLDASALRAEVERAMVAMEDVRRIKSQLASTANEIEDVRTIVDGMAERVRGHLAQIDAMVAAAGD